MQTTTTWHTEENTLNLRHSFATHYQRYHSDRDHSYTRPLASHDTLPGLRSTFGGYHTTQPLVYQQQQHHIGSSFMHSDYERHQERQLDSSPYDSNVPLPHGTAAWTQPTAHWSTSPADTYMSNTMGFASVQPVSGSKRLRPHQRTPSASTEASSGPDSPHTFNSSNPQIANTDFDPTHHQSFEKTPSIHSAFLSPNYPLNHFSTDMKGVAFDNHQLEDLPTPGAGRTMANTENELATPAEEVENKKTAFRQHPQLQLARTESAAYQDELYNPADMRAVTRQTTKQMPAPSSHRSLIEKRLKAAEDERSHSPSLSRDRSPFREGSTLADRQPYILPQGQLTDAANRRQRIEQEREDTQNALRRPQLQREPTKTISPKDALLDYNDGEPSLFQDTIPGGYKQHNGSEVLNSAYLQQQNPTFTLPPSSSQTSMAGFRASSTDFANGGAYTFAAPAIPTTAAATASMQLPFQMGNYLTPAYQPITDATPDFPAHLTSMESSMSEGPPMSSQESIQRPADTRANTGTYTCTYHGCTQRFESQPLLQRHKREFHRSQQQPTRDSLSVETSSASPRSTASPGPTGSGLTSAQILARNSQAGPHKCTRINPSTGKPCNTIFSRPYDLTRHEDTIHNGRKQKVRCPYCREEKTFSRNDALTRHLRVVHPDVESMGKRGRRGD